MARREDIDRLLKDWAYEPGEVVARLVRGGEGREVLQMRVELGILQLEVDGRPDGARPGGCPTCLEHFRQLAIEEDGDFELSEEQRTACDREFLQFYHRRICWLALRDFQRAARDADHSLALMDFARAHSNDEEWILSHEQYRPFVLFHKTQATALVALEDRGPGEAIKEIDDGLNHFRQLFEEYEAEDQYEEDELVQRLVELRESLREQYHVEPTLSEQLAQAIAAEQYEQAARLRDQIAQTQRH